MKDNEKGKELRDDMKQEMWENVISFLKELDLESIADTCWQYSDDGAVERINITFAYPIYLTVKAE